jgi:hypothetical protein
LYGRGRGQHSGERLGGKMVHDGEEIGFVEDEHLKGWKRVGRVMS